MERQKQSYLRGTAILLVTELFPHAFVSASLMERPGHIFLRGTAAPRNRIVSTALASCTYMHIVCHDFGVAQ